MTMKTLFVMMALLIATPAHAFFGPDKRQICANFEAKTVGNGSTAQYNLETSRRLGMEPTDKWNSIYNYCQYYK